MRPDAIIKTLEDAGFEARYVGGCVRDTLLDRPIHDWDIASQALPEDVLRLFPHCVPTGIRHGTVTVLLDGVSAEVTTYRLDGAYHDGRHPDGVRFVRSLAEDLARRDLTVNAMAMDVRGDITDLYGGRDDLRRGILRCVGDPDKRFDEDALRIMRTLRFAAVLGFTVEAHTAAALHRCAPLLRDIAAERLLTEMDRLLCGGYVLPVLLAYPDVLGVFLPELLPCVGLDQRNRHHRRVGAYRPLCGGYSTGAGAALGHAAPRRGQARLLHRGRTGRGTLLRTSQGVGSAGGGDLPPPADGQAHRP